MAEVKLNLKLQEEPFVLALTSEEGLVVSLDASPVIGGKGKGMRPMELLAGSLAGCMSIDVLSILKKQRVEVKHYEVAISGSRAITIPSKYESVSLEFIVDQNIPLDKLNNAIKLSHEKYCSVSASLDKQIQINTTVRQLA